MLWLEEKYINLLSPRLKLFSKVRHGQWTFRCPICGDSKKNAYKVRGGIYLPSKATQYVMGCFNCGASMKFVNFMKLIDPRLYEEYAVEKYKESHASNEPKKLVEDKKPDNKRLNLSGLECVSDLDSNHPAVKYLERRKISADRFDRLYFVLQFKKWEYEFRNQKPVNHKLENEHPRLVIPFFDTDGNITRISARAFGNEEPKYIYMKVKEDASRVYGLDTVNKYKKVYVFEGPLDSLFIDNSIAIGSADLIVPELDNYKNFVLVPDNQPRNKEVCKSIKKMVMSGKPICLWNEYWGKDVNDMIKAGKTPEEVKTLIDQSTVSGMEAMMRFSQWAKVSV